MISVSRLKNRLIALVINRFPRASDLLVASYSPWESQDVPWTPAAKPLSNSVVALVTTAGIHHAQQQPFDMKDPDGDPTYRILDPETIGTDYRITHDYYDHRDAEKDINIVFPVDRLKQMKNAGFIGGLSKRYFGFMGHITGAHIMDLIENRSRRVAEMLLEDGTDAVLLTPG